MKRNFQLSYINDIAVVSIFSVIYPFDLLRHTLHIGVLASILRKSST